MCSFAKIQRTVQLYFYFALQNKETKAKEAKYWHMSGFDREHVCYFIFSTVILFKKLYNLK